MREGNLTIGAELLLNYYNMILNFKKTKISLFIKSQSAETDLL